MNALPRILIPLLTVVGVATAQVTIMPVTGGVHHGRAGEQPTDETYVYALTNNGFSSTPYFVTWDPNAIPSTPMRLNGGLANSASGTIPAFSTAFVSVGFVPSPNVVQGTHTFTFQTESGIEVRTHQVDIGEVLVGGISHSAVSPEPAGSFFSVAVNLHNSMPFTADVSIRSADNNFFGSPDEVSIPANSSQTALIHVVVPPGHPVGHYRNAMEFFERSNNFAPLGEREVTYDYGRYPATDMPRFVPDLGDITSEILVPDPHCLVNSSGGLVEERFGRRSDQIAVELELTHASVSDLEVSLISPDGHVIYLHNLTDQPGPDLRRTYGVYEADGPGDLDDVLGTLASGVWTLRVRDLEDGESGFLRNWALRLPSMGYNCRPRAGHVTKQATVLEEVSVLLPADASEAFRVELTSLPPSGTVVDGNNQVVTSVPYTLPSNFLRYTPLQDGVATMEYSVIRIDNGSRAHGSVRVETGPRSFAFYEDFAVDPGWTTEGEWGYGDPNGPTDPNGLSGPSYAYNLHGDYAPNMSEAHLTTPPLDLSNMVSGRLEFRRMLHVYGYPHDNAGISASRDNGVTWEPVWTHDTHDLFDPDWTWVVHDLSSFDGEPHVLLRWTMGATDGDRQATGWTVRDVGITTLQNPSPRPAFEADVEQAEVETRRVYRRN